jgi:hypothetical protein
VTTAVAPAVALVLMLAIAAGCAPRSLDVGYPATAGNQPLSHPAALRRVVVGAVTDRRVDQGRIGSKPEDGQPILTSRSVPDIVRDALLVELGRGSQDGAAGPGDVIAAADVEEFWLDAVGRSATTLYVGRVVIAVTIADAVTGARVLSRRYVGSKRRTGEADAKNVWREVMEVALARATHDLVTDPDLAAALATRTSGGGPAGRASRARSGR